MSPTAQQSFVAPVFIAHRSSFIARCVATHASVPKVIFGLMTFGTSGTNAFRLHCAHTQGATRNERNRPTDECPETLSFGARGCAGAARCLAGDRSRRLHRAGRSVR